MKEHHIKFFSIKVLAVLFACVCMWGCGDYFKESSHKEWDYRDLKKIVGFFDDSLVIVSDARRWHEISDENGDIVGLGSWGHHALYLYNYRVQENGPRWMDSLDNGFYDGFEYFRGQLNDSVIWGADGNQISFWKVYGKPYKIDVEKLKDGCQQDFDLTKLKTWFDGRFIAMNDMSLTYSGDSCQYAVLDTAEKTLTYKRLNKDLEWIGICEDVVVVNGDLDCLTMKDNSENAYLLVNGANRDTLPLGNLYLMGNLSKDVMKSTSFMGRILNVGNDLWYLNKDKEIINLDVHVVQDGSFPANPGITFKNKNFGEVKY